MQFFGGELGHRRGMGEGEGEDRKGGVGEGWDGVLQE